MSAIVGTTANSSLLSHINIYRNRHHQVAVFLAEQDAKQRDYDIKASGLYDYTVSF